MKNEHGGNDAHEGLEEDYVHRDVGISLQGCAVHFRRHKERCQHRMARMRRRRRRGAKVDAGEEKVDAEMTAPGIAAPEGRRRHKRGANAKTKSILNKMSSTPVCFP